MKTLEIIGENYFGVWDKTRTACRGIVIRDGEILLCHEALTDIWMIPGGGKETDENESECCIREVAEETGCLIEVSPCILQIDEYYQDWKYVSRYFSSKVIGQCDKKLTKREEEAGMEARWITIEEALRIFSMHASYADENEEKRGIYQREYMALCEIFRERIL